MHLKKSLLFSSGFFFVLFNSLITCAYSWSNASKSVQSNRISTLQISNEWPRLKRGRDEKKIACNRHFLHKIIQYNSFSNASLWRGNKCCLIWCIYYNDRLRRFFSLSLQFAAYSDLLKLNGSEAFSYSIVGNDAWNFDPTVVITKRNISKRDKHNIRQRWKDRHLSALVHAFRNSHCCVNSVYLAKWE